MKISSNFFRARAGVDSSGSRNESSSFSEQGLESILPEAGIRVLQFFRARAGVDSSGSRNESSSFSEQGLESILPEAGIRVLQFFRARAGVDSSGSRNQSPPVFQSKGWSRFFRKPESESSSFSEQGLESILPEAGMSPPVFQSKGWSRFFRKPESESSSFSEQGLESILPEAGIRVLQFFRARAGVDSSGSRNQSPPVFQSKGWSRFFRKPESESSSFSEQGLELILPEAGMRVLQFLEWVLVNGTACQNRS